MNPNEIQKRGAYIMKRYPYVVIGIAVAAVALSFFNAWYLLVGLIALLAFGYFATASMGAAGGDTTAPPALPKAQRMDLDRLNGKYRECVEQALSRRASIERMVADTADPGMRRALTESTHDLPELTDTIYGLAIKAQSVQTVLDSTRTMDTLTEEIERLENQIKSTTDEFQRSQYYASLDGKLQQMQNLTDTKVAVERWDSQIDNALSTMDTILSQVARMQSSEVLSYTGATDSMSHSLREQVDELKATSDALDTVYGWKS
jgi:hypothetical protein